MAYILLIPISDGSIRTRHGAEKYIREQLKQEEEDYETVIPVFKL